MMRTWLVRLPAIELTLSVRSFQVPDAPRTLAWPPSLPSVPTSRATRVTSSANAESRSTMMLIVVFSSRISPRASTSIFLVRSPRATAVVTSAMLRTWAVSVPAMKFTESVRSLPGAGRAPDLGLAAEPALRADLAGHPGDLVGEPGQLVDHRVDGRLELQQLAGHVDGDLAGQVAAGDRGGHLGDVAQLGGQVAGHRVDVVGEVLPGAGHPGHRRLAAEHALGADLAGDPGDLVGERRAAGRPSC